MPAKNPRGGFKIKVFWGNLSQKSILIVAQSRQEIWLKRFDFVPLLVYNVAGRHTASPSSLEGTKLNQLSLHLHAPADSGNQAVVSPIRGCSGIPSSGVPSADERRDRFSFMHPRIRVIRRLCLLFVAVVAF